MSLGFVKNGLWMGKHKMRKDYDTGMTEASIAGIWTILETTVDLGFDFEEADKLCDHMYVWLCNENDSQVFKCHECDDITVM